MVVKKEEKVAKPKKPKAVKEAVAGKPSGAPSLKQEVSEKKGPDYYICIFRIEGNPLYRSMILSKKEMVFDGKVPPVITDITWYCINKQTGELSKD